MEAAVVFYAGRSPRFKTKSLARGLALGLLLKTKSLALGLGARFNLALGLLWHGVFSLDSRARSRVVTLPRVA